MPLITQGKYDVLHVGASDSFSPAYSTNIGASARTTIQHIMSSCDG